MLVQHRMRDRCVVVLVTACCRYLLPMPHVGEQTRYVPSKEHAPHTTNCLLWVINVYLPICRVIVYAMTESLQTPTSGCNDIPTCTSSVTWCSVNPVDTNKRCLSRSGHAAITHCMHVGLVSALHILLHIASITGDPFVASPLTGRLDLTTNS